MRIAVVGSGYVGLVAGACFADSGNHVSCVDSNAEKVAALKAGKIPIYEPGLSEIVERNVKAGRLDFSTDLPAAVKTSKVIFIGVGTPEGADGGADLSAIFTVARQIGQAMDAPRIVVMKSTVPVGTHKKVTEIMASVTEHRVQYVSNPEFLKEGAAIADFTRPDRVVIGTDDPMVATVIKELYAPFTRRNERILVMSPASAELTKYAANAMLAARISFMNEISHLCDCYGADVEQVRRGMGSDSRIGDAFLYAGVGYGGSCFPKDVNALAAMGRAMDEPMRIVEAVEAVNRELRARFANRVIQRFKGNTQGTKLGAWGLAFKARTDDVRESPAIEVIRLLAKEGFKIRVHDPEAMGTGGLELKGSAECCDDGYDVLDGAAALLIFTDWPQFRTPDFDLMEQKLAGKVVFDGRNLYDPQMMADRGFEYHCVGRPHIPPA